MSRRIHKLVQVIFLSFPVVAQYVRLENFYITFFSCEFQVLGETIYITYKYLSLEAKAMAAGSKVEVLEAKNAKLKRDLISAMDEANTAKEKAKTLADDLRVEKQVMV